MRRSAASLFVFFVACAAPHPRAARAPKQDEHPVSAPMPPLERVSPQVRDAWQLADVLVRGAAADEGHVLPEAEIRAYYALGWTPWQASRRDVYERVIGLLRERADDDARQSVIAAVIVARMQESLALDWRRVVATECKGDPTLCSAGVGLRDSAMRIWFERAREGYRFCVLLGTRIPELDDWRRYCEARAGEIGSGIRVEAAAQLAFEGQMADACRRALETAAPSARAWASGRTQTARRRSSRSNTACMPARSSLPVSVQASAC